jgi:hypothetical protein
MALIISRPCYASRDEVMRSVNIKPGVIDTPRVDRALQSASDNIDGHLKRVFYPWDATRFWDWPNYQYAYPWRLWLGRHDILCPTLIQSPGAGANTPVTIPLNQVKPRPASPQRGFPFTSLELDRGTSAAFAPASSPQNSIWITGTWGFTADADNLTTITSSIISSATTMTVADGSGVGPGDVLILGYARGTAPYPAYNDSAGAIQPYTGERVICQDKTTAATGLTQSGAGCTTAAAADATLQWTGTGSLNAGEVLLLDSERMLVTDITGSVATVERAWDGTELATHSAATIYAFRTLTVVRGELGTTAAAWASSTAVWRHRPPQLIRDLCIAEAATQVLSEVAAYSRNVGGEGGAAVPAGGGELADKWDECVTRFGRKARIGAI